ncbi:hypothetical protein F511_05119 [Dorcoceras hygrometricum]|uniref:J domain-containing protein n=1 Tax=Dorcoceras hygrometricum TaxID=472368 RepID=A0A2Z7AP33_9LAMI|nr:hypothetical protein F511_05119 [Dorcoceras hygrometricum]
MECNKDEALRAKSIAEGKLEKKDFAGAKKFAVKAQTLYPGLDGIPQMLAILDVYVSAENKINGEVDWYGVLGVKPTADDETIRKQYRKFALMLHPDKNKSVRADGAFKLVSEAWSMLSDTAKRLAYNLRRGSKGFPLKVPIRNAGSSAPKANGCYDFARRTASVSKTENNNVKVSAMPNSTPSYQRTNTVPKTTQNNDVKVPSTPTPMPFYQRTDTFWTICHRCNMHYEYLKVYLNNTLLCPNCKKGFMASETAPPISFPKVTNQVPQQRQQNPGNHAPSQHAHGLGRNGASGGKPAASQSDPTSVRHANHLKNPHSETANVRTMDPSIAAKAATVVQQAQDKLKRAYAESYSPTGWETHLKKKKLDEDVSPYGMSANIAQGHSGSGTSSSTVGSRSYGFFGMSHQPDSVRDLTPVETRNMLMEKARKEISKKLTEWRLEAVARPAYKEKVKAKASEKEIRKSTGKISERAERHVTRSYVDKQTKDPAMAPITVPDPDFHDFDLDRTEGSFGDNEVWAAYDDDDGMPRFYALINKVISRKPFKLRISWLSSRTNTEFSSLDWVSSGFYKTCGEFRVGRYETCKYLNAFSHKVNWAKGLRGSILILPQKGDIWAVYRNWSSDWNEHTPDEVIHKYDMVTVLDDYSEEHGISVAPLVKISSFKTVFRPNMDPNLIKRIPKEEVFRLSHQVPNHLLTGQEAEKAPKGCLELDPAATPLELIIQGTKEADEASIETVNVQVTRSIEITNSDKTTYGKNENTE